MKQAYGLSAQLTVGSPNPAVFDDFPVSGLLITATVAGAAQVTLSGGTVVSIACPVGTTIYQDLAVIEINSSTATATYYQLA
jgi:hypothetical protein